MELTDDDGPLDKFSRSIRITPRAGGRRRVLWCEDSWTLERLGFGDFMLSGASLPDPSVVEFVAEVIQPEEIATFFDWDPRGLLIAASIRHMFSIRYPAIRVRSYGINPEVLRLSVAHRVAGWESTGQRDPIALQLMPLEARLAQRAISELAWVDQEARAALREMGRRGIKYELAGVLNPDLHNAAYRLRVFEYLQS